jgi:hypothetical protein
MKQRTASVLNQGPPAADLDGLLQLSGITVPSDGVAGYATGCIFQHTDGAAETALYVNEGSDTSAAFVALAAASTTEISDLSDVGTTVYTAGMLLVADGDSFEEVAVSSHATLAANGALTLATVTKKFTIALSSLRQEDAAQTTLPTTPDGNGGTLGLGAAAGTAVLGSESNSGVTGTQREYAMFDFVVPEDYVVGEDLTVDITCLVSDTRDTASPLDLIVKHIKAGALDSTDIQATAAIDIKDVVAAAAQNFTITGDASGDELAAGSVLNILIDVTTVDTSEAANGHVQINEVAVNVPCYR